MRQVEILEDGDAVGLRLVERIIAAAADAIATRGRFTIALTGGTTPEKSYRRLALPENAGRLDWTRSLVFVGDERDVPMDDPRSNWGNARRQLLDLVPLPPENGFPIVGTPGDPQGAARRHEEALRRAFPGDPIPRFDLFLLGMGDDGHCASLFPGYPSLDIIDRLVVASPPGVLPPPVDRITSTFPLINAAREVMFIVTGEKKAATLVDVLETDPPFWRRPAAGVNPALGTLTWLLDEPAASLLSTATRQH